MRATGTVRGMSQHDSRWSLAHTGNRILLAVVIGVLLTCLCGGANLPVATQLVILLVTAGATYALATLIQRSRR